MTPEVEWTRRYQAALHKLGAQLGAAATAAFLALPAHNEQNIPDMVAAMDQATAATRHTAGQLTSGYLAFLTQQPAVPVGIATPDPAELWRDPFISTWQALGSGLTLADAVQAGAARADTTGRDTVVNAAYDQSSVFHGAYPDSIQGWIRVLDGNACDWCVEVADQVYSSADSADFGHNNCGCTPAPLIGDSNPGQQLNQEQQD